MKQTGAGSGRGLVPENYENPPVFQAGYTVKPLFYGIVQPFIGVSGKSLQSEST
jgi:hypothetical protein